MRGKAFCNSAENFVKYLYSPNDDQKKWSKHAVILIKHIEYYTFSVLCQTEHN